MIMEKKIKFTSTISDGKEQLDHSFIAYGDVYVSDDGMRRVLDFPEPIEDGLTLATSIILTDDTLKIVREGVVSMAQEFVRGQEIAGTYETEYGELDTSVYTTALEVSGDVDAGEIYLVYDLYLDATYTSQVSLSIEYE